jgi:hypothetical protein
MAWWFQAEGGNLPHPRDPTFTSSGSRAGELKSVILRESRDSIPPGGRASYMTGHKDRNYLGGSQTELTERLSPQQTERSVSS